LPIHTTVLAGELLLERKEGREGGREGGKGEACEELRM